MTYDKKLKELGLSDYEIYELEMDTENYIDELSARDRKYARFIDVLSDLAYERYNVSI